jgi:MFS family permease
VAIFREEQGGLANGSGRPQKMRATAPIQANVPVPSLADILKKREAWGTFLGLFCSNYAWYFMLTWLPQYLLLERHYSTRMLALTGWLPFCATATGAVLGGWLSDAWIRRGASTDLARKTFCVTRLCGSAVLLLPSDNCRAHRPVLFCFRLGLRTVAGGSLFLPADHSQGDGRFVERFEQQQKRAWSNFYWIILEKLW